MTFYILNNPVGHNLVAELFNVRNFAKLNFSFSAKDFLSAEEEIDTGSPINLLPRHLIACEYS